MFRTVGHFFLTEDQLVRQLKSDDLVNVIDWLVLPHHGISQKRRTQYTQEIWEDTLLMVLPQLNRHQASRSPQVITTRLKRMEQEQSKPVEQEQEVVGVVEPSPPVENTVVKQTLIYSALSRMQIALENMNEC